MLRRLFGDFLGYHTVHLAYLPVKFSSFHRHLQPLITMATSQTTAKPFCLSWPCLQADAPIPPPKTPNPKSVNLVQQKTFAQALSNVCDIPHSQLPKPCLKGDDLAISIPDDEYDAGLDACKHNLQGRVIWPKGSAPVSIESLNKLSVLWKSLGRWGVISLGKGFYEFVFSSVEDLRRVRSVSSWNLNPGILKLFAWSQNFSANNQYQTNAQVWVRIYGLSQEYWRKKILFAIASSVGTPICTDSISGKPMIERTFGHFARVLVDMDLAQQLRYRVLVERKGYAFFVDLEYENLPDFCEYCKIPGHHVDVCKRRKQMNYGNVQREQSKKKEAVVIRQEFVPVTKVTEVVIADTNVENHVAHSLEQQRKQADMDLEKEINDELAEVQVCNQASSSKVPPPEAHLHVEDEHSSTGSQFVEATQESNKAATIELEAAAATPEIVLKDMAFLKESWANLADLDEDVHVDEDVQLAANNITLSRAGTALVQVRNPSPSSALDANTLADNTTPTIDDQGFQLVTTKASKKKT